MNFIFIFCLSTIALVSCSISRVKPQPKKTYARNYRFTDISGSFLLDLKSGLKKNNQFYVRQRLIGENDQKEYEKIIALSTLGSLKVKGKDIPVIRPLISHYTGWLEKKKYISQLKIIPQKKLLEVTTLFDENKESKVKKIPFQSPRGIFCFFHQIPDCVRITGFLNKAIHKKYGTMSFTIIWENYPFTDRQYSSLSGPFNLSTLSYKGRSREGNFVFHLNFGNQVIFYHFNQDLELEKKFWIAQGIEQIGV